MTRIYISNLTIVGSYNISNLTIIGSDNVAKPLSEPTLVYCQLNPQEWTSVKY